MKNIKYAIILAAILGLAMVSPTQAKVNINVRGDSKAEVKIKNVINSTTTTTSNIDVRVTAKGTSTKSKIDAKLDAKLDTRAEKKEAKYSKKPVDVKAKLKANAERLLNHYRERISVLKKLAARLESRITKIETRGFSLTQSRTLLSEANAKINAAENDSIRASADIAILLEENFSTTTIMRIKSRLNKTEVLIKEAHKSLVQAISSVKVGLEASTQATSSTQ